ncbi:ATP synthase subunit I [Geopsychrobacter electrodiphilus]|uniref:ATP synthase subunit I n=1 Tax=Geopsychrobacter electrodiphilus TaxID=225196 RepID=UPI00037BC723|nr:ATP synthase subunit I [Geopsychrobacter electrodiphilus]
MTNRDDQLLKDIGRLNWFVLVFMVLVSLFWRSAPVTLGVVAGGLLVILNFGWMGRSLMKVISSPQAYSPRGFKRNYFFRLLFVGSTIFLLLVRGGVDPLALVFGLSVVVISLLLTTLKRLY